ncbi:twin-arginine translocation protein TatB [Methylophaga lonarensis MPL]|uniref:Sec-independent protein translocase protein TatB n=1 Tax=Methylophaga lonarensis MPL TaxID=1286106 RepID=M7PDG9_9GAMM|nr:Sec-independent protein translocase protein TatB [Methylophaga lonarensis]EMR11940.1 twin-arginine translocation protein TatB [Methylophaga lonarensis MPL]
MFDIGFWEILLISVVALIVVGPERLPRLARVTGLWLGRANATLQGIKSEISKELRAEELKQALRKPDDLPDMNEIINIDEATKPDRASTPTSNKTSDQDNNVK